MASKQTVDDQTVLLDSLRTKVRRENVLLQQGKGLQNVTCTRLAQTLRFVRDR